MEFALTRCMAATLSLALLAGCGRADPVGIWVGPCELGYYDDGETYTEDYQAVDMEMVLQKEQDEVFGFGVFSLSYTTTDYSNIVGVDIEGVVDGNEVLLDLTAGYGLLLRGIGTISGDQMDLDMDVEGYTYSTDTTDTYDYGLVFDCLLERTPEVDAL